MQCKHLFFLMLLMYWCTFSKNSELFLDIRNIKWWYRNKAKNTKSAKIKKGMFMFSISHQSVTECVINQVLTEKEIKEVFCLFPSPKWCFYAIFNMFKCHIKFVSFYLKYLSFSFFKPLKIIYVTFGYIFNLFSCKRYS